MQVPVQITFRGLDPSEFIEKAVRAQAERLERFHDRVTRCHVTVEEPHQRHHQGNLFRVRVDVTIPGAEIVVGREPGDPAHEDVYVAIRDAFNTATRRLEDAQRRPRGERHTREGAQHGTVRRLFPEKHYGFLETEDGMEVYFHENSVLNGRFARLHEGDRVRVVIADETESLRGPQASTVEQSS